MIKDILGGLIMAIFIYSLFFIGYIIEPLLYKWFILSYNKNIYKLVNFIWLYKTFVVAFYQSLSDWRLDAVCYNIILVKD